TAGFSEKHACCFEDCKDVIAKAVTLAHPKDDTMFCLFVDASKDHWGIMLTQTDPEMLKKRDIADQGHEPLAFLSGTFRGAQQRWAIIEKEAFPIMEATIRLKHFLLRDKGFTIFTDHRNLVYIFDPERRAVNEAKHTSDRLERWTWRLSPFGT
ncbi:hypothetical protein BVRB_042070, partial [Beta vulgaris subsp. vulgaris]